MRRTVLLLTLVAAMLLSCGAVALAQQLAGSDEPFGPSRPTGAQKSALPSKEKSSPTDGQATASGDVSATALSQPVALGARIERAPDEPTKIDEFINLVGAKPPVVMWFSSWALCAYPYNSTNGEGCFDPAELEEVVNRGAMPMVTWQPWHPDKGAYQTGYTLKKIVAGQHDAYIRKWARDAKAWGKPMYLRFAHEMNGTWYPWSPGLNGNTSSQYVSAWKRVHGIFQREGATNVKWVWSPYVACGGCAAFSSVYPGGSYVDWVALDGYNWGTSQPGTRWQSMAEVFGPSYDKVTALAPTKPFMIAEVSSAEQGGDKAAWIRNGFLDTNGYRGDIPNRMPKTKAVVWFHRNKEIDWRVNSSQASLDAYKEVVASASYQGRLP